MFGSLSTTLPTLKDVQYFSFAWHPAEPECSQRIFLAPQTRKPLASEKHGMWGTSRSFTPVFHTCPHTIFSFCFQFKCRDFSPKFPSSYILYSKILADGHRFPFTRWACGRKSFISLSYTKFYVFIKKCNLTNVFYGAFPHLYQKELMLVF